MAFKPKWSANTSRFFTGAGVSAVAFTVFAALIFLTATAFAEPKFPPLTGRIVDDAHLLTPEDKAAIEADLKALEAKSSDQIVVYTANSLQGYPIEDFGYQLGRVWGIGQKGTNNGVILIVAPTERKVRIEVGRGLEPQLTDLLSTQIIQNRILPQFRRGQYSAGIKAGVQDIKDVLLGDAEEVKRRAAARPQVRKADDWGAVIPVLFIFGIFAFVMWAQARQARQPLSGGRYRRGTYGGGPIFFPGGWGGGGSGGGWGGGDGGGFSGGGGDFGGGGASGGW